MDFAERVYRLVRTAGEKNAEEPRKYTDTWLRTFMKMVTELKEDDTVSQAIVEFYEEEWEL